MRTASTIDDRPLAAGPDVSPAAPDPADVEGTRVLGARMVVSDDVALESQDDTHVVVANVAQGTRARLSRSAYRFLQAFRQPRRVDEILSANDARRALPQVRMLVDRRLLEDADTPAGAQPTRVRTAVAYKFCNAPAYVARQSPDFVVLGIPHDLSGETDGRLAPGLIRQKSLDYPYQLRFDDARPRGWFDADRAAWILKGATIADAGDVHVDYGETKARFRDRVAVALAHACSRRTVPLILGGDRGVTAAAIAGLPCRRNLAVVQITADPARATDEGAGEQLRRLEHVRQVVTLDGRGGISGIADAAGDDLAVYLSIDLDIVASVPKPRPVPVPDLHDLKDLIAAIGAAHAIVGIDLVGLDMRKAASTLGAITGCQLALTAMSAAHDRTPA